MVIALVIRGKIYRLHLIRLGIKRKRKNPFGVAMTVFCNNITHITHLHSLPAIGKYEHWTQNFIFRIHQYSHPTAPSGMSETASGVPRLV